MTDLDPRTMLFRSFDQAARVVNGVAPEQLRLPTPCREFNVAALLTHLGGVGNRIAGIGRGEPQTQALPVPKGVADDKWGPAFEASRQQAQASWADDEILERIVALPFGTFPGSVVAQIYLLELTTHTWDLAVATAQLGLLDDELAEASLSVAQRVLLPEHRGGDIPFDPVVPVADDASAYDRLAGFLGRRAA